MTTTGHEIRKRGPYELTLINGVQGDPGIYCFSPKTGEACLFDAGLLENLGNRQILKARHVFITHTHIDHFVGFDRLLRVNVPHGRELHLFGPVNFAKNVQGKVRGFLWNLLEPGQLKFRITEVLADGSLQRFRMHNDDGFTLHPVAPEPEPATKESSPSPVPHPAPPVVALTTLADQARVEAVVLDHGTPVVGYLIQGATQFHIRPGALEDLGLTPGPWISQLQRAITTMAGDTLYELGSKVSSLQDLSARIFESSTHRPFGYLTDFSFTQDNLTRIKAAMTGVEVLFCEATFRDADVTRATAKKHLTTRQAALIARLLGARELQVFHISNIYGDTWNESLAEAAQLFNQASTWTDQHLSLEINKELSRATAPRHPERSAGYYTHRRC